MYSRLYLAKDNKDDLGYPPSSLSNVESDITYARPKPCSLSSPILLPPPRRFLFYAPSLHDAIFLFSEIHGRSF